MFKAEQVARFLAANGIPVVKFSEASEVENLDGEVELTERVSVQVGANYIYVVRRDGDTFIHSPEFPTPVAAMPTVREQLRYEAGATLDGSAGVEAADSGRKIVSGDDIAGVLATLGEDVTAERVEAVGAQLAKQALPAGADAAAVQHAVDTARRAIAQQQHDAAASAESLRFDDGRKFVRGDRVAVATGYGTRGNGTVIGFGLGAGRVATVKVQMDGATTWGARDRWPVNAQHAAASGHSHYERPRDEGVAGGEIAAKLKREPLAKSGASPEL